jgi:hypothetical protein
MNSLTRHLIFFGVGAGLSALVLFVYTQYRGPEQGSTRSTAKAPTKQQRQRPSSQSLPPGHLRRDGLRLQPSGRSDSSGVLSPVKFARPEVKRAYQIARTIPAMLNKLYCWCKCENRGIHRSNLACFEDRMATSCAVCRGTAKIAHDMKQKGVTDPAKIQAAVDKEWGAKWARKEQQNQPE